ncbi:MFS transporter [Herbiconiux ginsengi]|uniref:Sugar phosphate permease n=1 Tax=Herbiconiux ginsengi TaxID=381665 RepID=A0A1H3TBN3_9MICO|nr:MFS transporter [Herbiconiux ginsengi]SDZ47682.1 Sugar phosphate permease [Herbiconiux ginsengi]
MITVPPATVRRSPNRWWFVITAMLALILGAGTLNVLFNVAAVPMIEEFGWTLADFTNGASFATVAAGISALAVGILVSRFGPRIPTVPISLAFGGAVVLLGTANQSVGYWYFLCILLGAVAGASTPVAHVTVVTAWFSDRRGVALGLLAVGSALGTILMPPIATAIEAGYGWRGVYIAVGVLCVIIPPAVYAFVTRLPAGTTMQQSAGTDAAASSSIRLVARRRQFWLLLGGILLVSTALFGLLSQVFPISASHGYAPETAALLLSSLAVSSLVVHGIVGFLLDRLYAPGIAVVLFVLGGVGTVLLFTSTTLPMSFLGAILVGVAFGAEGDVASYIVGRFFPLGAYARVVGLVFFMLTIGGAIGIFLIGQLYVATGGYTVPMVVLVSLVGAGILCFLGFGRYTFSLDGSPVTRLNTLGKTPSEVGV